jgi:CHAT domain-containing protein
LKAGWRLWVADNKTLALMVDYYQRLLKGEGRSAALREAQKAMIANPATKRPYYWAAFLPIGDWTPLAAKECRLASQSLYRGES